MRVIDVIILSVFTVMAFHTLITSESVFGQILAFIGIICLSYLIRSFLKEKENKDFKDN